MDDKQPLKVDVVRVTCRVLKLWDPFTSLEWVKLCTSNFIHKLILASSCLTYHVILHGTSLYLANEWSQTFLVWQTVGPWHNTSQCMTMVPKAAWSGKVTTVKYGDFSIFMKWVKVTMHFNFCTACLLIKGAHKVHVAQVMWHFKIIYGTPLISGMVHSWTTTTTSQQIIEDRIGLDI